MFYIANQGQQAQAQQGAQNDTQCGKLTQPLCVTLLGWGKAQRQIEASEVAYLQKNLLIGASG